MKFYKYELLREEKDTRVLLKKINDGVKLLTSMGKIMSIGNTLDFLKTFGVSGPIPSMGPGVPKYPKMCPQAP